MKTSELKWKLEKQAKKIEYTPIQPKLAVPQTTTRDHQTNQGNCLLLLRCIRKKPRVSKSVALTVVNITIQHLVKGFLTPQAEGKFSERRIAVLSAYELVIDLQIAQVTRNAETAIHQVIINPYVSETRTTPRNKNLAHLVLLKHPPHQPPLPPQP